MIRVRSARNLRISKGLSSPNSGKKRPDPRNRDSLLSSDSEDLGTDLPQDVETELLGELATKSPRHPEPPQPQRVAVGGQPSPDRRRLQALEADVGVSSISLSLNPARLMISLVNCKLFWTPRWLRRPPLLRYRQPLLGRRNLWRSIGTYLVPQPRMLQPVSLPLRCPPALLRPSQRDGK